MYTSYGLTKAVLKAIYEGDQNDLMEQIADADVEVLADEIFNMVGIIIHSLGNKKRETIVNRLLDESTRYDFETLTNNLQGRFIFPSQQVPREG